MRTLSLLLVTWCACDSESPSPDGGGDADASCAEREGWTSAPSMPAGPTQETAVVEVGGKIYSLGGFDDALGVLDEVQVFDAATCAWSSALPLPRPMHHINAAVLGGRIYILGALSTLQFTSVGDTWSIDPTSETTWTPHAPMPAGSERGASATAVLGDTIVVAGGLRGRAVAQASAYRPSTDEWLPMPALPTERDHGCAATVGGAMYVIGGRASVLDGSVVKLSVGGTAWEAQARMITARGGIACGVVDDEVIVVGGEGNTAVSSGVFAEVEAYTPATNTWRSLAPMVTPRHGMGAAGLGGKLYVPGGGDREGFAAVDTHEVFSVP